MTSEQLELDLFPVSTPPVVEDPLPNFRHAVPFPLDRQIAYVRKIARALDARDERLAAKYWRTECNRLRGRLQVQGFDAGTIQAEIVKFANAVGRERARSDQRQPEGAA